jgi:hypothetical protein
MVHHLDLYEDSVHFNFVGAATMGCQTAAIIRQFLPARASAGFLKLFTRRWIQLEGGKPAVFQGRAHISIDRGSVSA